MIAAALGLAWLLFEIFRPMFAPVIWAIIIAHLFWPVHRRLLHRLADRRNLEAVLITIIAVCLLILPVLGLEYFRAEQVRHTPELALALHIGVAIIWIAFATEFVFRSSASPQPLRYAKERWLDLAIVVLPMLEFLLTRWVDAAPLARLLRLGRALSPEQLGGMQRVYRLRGLVTKAWQAFLVLGGMGRLLGNMDQKRLKDVEYRIETLEEELAELRKEAEELRSKVGLQKQD